VSRLIALKEPWPDQKRTLWQQPVGSVIKAYVKSMKLGVERARHPSQAVKDLVTISEEGIETQVFGMSTNDETSGRHMDPCT
jgi:hypothetical protein